jgi:TRAP-type uncharacterized transport system substrate-binding protein
MSRRFICVPLAAVLAFLSGCNPMSSSTQDLTTTITTGPQGGYYQKICQALQWAARPKGLEIACMPGSNGSQDNVYRLEQGQAEFGLVQSDVAHRAWKGEYPFDERQEHVQLVAPLFTEKVHILVRPHEYLHSVGQLKGDHRVWLGSKNSGSRSSGFAVLLAGGLSKNEVLNTAATSLDREKAFTLLRAEKHCSEADPPLDAVIDTRMPEDHFLMAILAASGMKTEHPGAKKNSRFTVLLSPDLSRSATAERKGLKIWVPAHWSHRQLAALERLGISGSKREMDVRKAFEQLQANKLDALVEGRQLSPKLVKSVLDMRGYHMVALEDAGHKQPRLRAYLRPGLEIASVTELAGKKVWWPEDEGLDGPIHRAVCGGECANELNAVREITNSIAMDLLRLGALDAVFQTTVAPNASVAHALEQKTELSLLGLDLSLVEKLVEDGSYVETSLQHSTYPSLEDGVYTVGVQTYLLTRLRKKDDADSRKVESMARILRANQADIERELQGIVEDDRAHEVKNDAEALKREAAVLRKEAKAARESNRTVKDQVQALEDRAQILEDQAQALELRAHALESKPEARNEIPAEPFALTLLGSPISSDVLDYVNGSANQFLVQPGRPHRGELLRIGIVLVAFSMLLACVLISERKEQLRPWAASGILFLLACVFVATVGAFWLQAVEGDITQDFVSFRSAVLSLGETVIANLHVPLKPPVPTTRHGQRVMEVFSWLEALLVGSYLLPFAKGLRRNRSASPAEEKTVPQPHEERAVELSPTRCDTPGCLVRLRAWLFGWWRWLRFREA